MKCILIISILFIGLEANGKEYESVNKIDPFSKIGTNAADVFQKAVSYVITKTGTNFRIHNYFSKRKYTYKSVIYKTGHNGN